MKPPDLEESHWSERQKAHQHCHQRKPQRDQLAATPDGLEVNACRRCSHHAAQHTEHIGAGQYAASGGMERLGAMMAIKDPIPAAWAL